MRAASPYFDAMFFARLEENKTSTVRIECTDVCTMSALVKYAYTAEIEICASNVQSLAAACDYFNFERLKIKCDMLMSKLVQSNNCIGFFKFGKMHHLNDTLTKAETCMQTRFMDIVRTSDEFLQLSVGDLIKYVSDSRLIMPAEDAVFEAVLKWMNVDAEERKASFVSIAEHIKFPFCSSAYLSDVVLREPLMADPKCQKFLMEALAFHLKPEHENDGINTRFIALASVRESEQLVVFGGNVSTSNSPRKLTHDAISWEGVTGLFSPYEYSSACVIPKGIFMSGGQRGNSVKSCCSLYNLAEESCDDFPDMACGRTRHGSVYHDRAIFIVGGMDGIENLAEVAKFDVKRQIWSEVSPMHQPLVDPLVVSFGSKIFVMSGMDEKNLSSTMTQEYDPVWDQWHFKAHMPEVCSGGAVVCLGDKIYIVGGSTKTCLSYEPSKDVWTKLTSPEECHSYAPAAVWDGKIVVGGGEYCTLVEEYDPHTDTWSTWDLQLEKPLFHSFMFKLVL